MKRFLLALCAVFLFAPGCATVGRDFDDSRVGSVVIGATTRAEIEQWFGPPHEQTTIAGSANGAVLRFTYAHARSTWGGTSTKSKSLVVDFNASDVVVDKGYSSTQ